MVQLDFSLKEKCGNPQNNKNGKKKTIGKNVEEN